MAAPFVPVPFPLDRTGTCRSWAKRGSPIHTTSTINREPSPPESIPWLRRVGPWGAAAGASTPDDSWSRLGGGVLDGSSMYPECEGNLWDSWVERPITPTLLGYEILEERAKFTVWRLDNKSISDRKRKMMMGLHNCVIH